MLDMRQTADRILEILQTLGNLEPSPSIRKFIAELLFMEGQLEAYYDEWTPMISRLVPGPVIRMYPEQSHSIGTVSHYADVPTSERSALLESSSLSVRETVSAARGIMSSMMMPWCHYLNVALAIGLAWIVTCRSKYEARLVEDDNVVTKREMSVVEVRKKPKSSMKRESRGKYYT